MFLCESVFPAFHRSWPECMRNWHFVTSTCSLPATTYLLPWFPYKQTESKDQSEFRQNETLKLSQFSTKKYKYVRFNLVQIILLYVRCVQVCKVLKVGHLFLMNFIQKTLLRILYLAGQMGMVLLKLVNLSRFPGSF